MVGLSVGALVLAGCFGGDSPLGVPFTEEGDEPAGGNTQVTPTDTADPCEPTEIEALERDEATELGFTPDEVIDRIAQGWTTTLVWTDGSSELFFLGGAYVEGTAALWRFEDPRSCPDAVVVEMDVWTQTLESTRANVGATLPIVVRSLSSVDVAWEVDDPTEDLEVGFVSARFTASATSGSLLDPDERLLASW